MKMFYFKNRYGISFIFFICFVLTLFSCNNNVDDFGKLKVQAASMTVDQARHEFASVLSRALSEKDIREFIKKEALQKIDDDYDVIYHYVKDAKMANGLTFHENIAKYSDDKIMFDQIVEYNKLLTIYVPFISKDFSAEEWDVEKQIPCVAIRNDDKKDDLEVLGKQGCSSVKRLSKPDFPVLVVKSNERLVDVNTTTKSTSNGLANNDGVFAYFLDNSFDKTKTIATRVPNAVLLYFNQNDLLQSAFIQNKECPRDYIYYGIGGNVDKGELIGKNREFIVSLEFCTPSVLGHINDKDDPTGDWSDGNLELCFDFIFVDKSGYPLAIQKMRSVRIDEMFNSSSSPTGTIKYNFSEPIEIFNWDMYTYGNIYKIAISEYDAGSIVEKTINHSSSFGTNFEASAGTNFGLFKVGAKFGTSTTSTKQTAVKVQTTNNSDPLGDVIINFFDPIYLNDKIKIRVTGSHYPPSQNLIVEFKDYTFNTATELWAYIDRVKRGEDYFSKYKFCFLDDFTVYGNTHESNTGMIKLKIQPMSLLN